MIKYLVLSVALIALFWVVKHRPAAPPSEVEIVSAPPGAANPTAATNLPTARAVTPGSKLSASVRPAVNEPTMEPGEEHADAGRVKRRNEEERSLREIREQTDAAMKRAASGR